MLYVYTFPNHTGGDPLVLRALLLGASDSGGLEGMVTCGLELLSDWLNCSECSVKTILYLTRLGCFLKIGYN